MLANASERDSRGRASIRRVDAVDPESTDIDPLKYLDEQRR